jgi:hypothetical protein
MSKDDREAKPAIDPPVDPRVLARRDQKRATAAA